jgi:hypothetical protein
MASYKSGMAGVNVNPIGGAGWATGLQQLLRAREAAQIIEETRGDAAHGLHGRPKSSGRPERLLGSVISGLLIREVKISRSLRSGAS